MEKKIICNCCGKEIRMENKIPMEDYLFIRKEWGYFSEKDGKMQEFCLCEACYDDLTSHFRIPVSETEVTELM